MEGIERINTVVVRNFLQGQGEREEKMRRDLYVIDVNRERNYYNCRRFGHLVHNCKNQEIIGQERRIEYRNNLNTLNNLKEEENLVVFN